MVFFLARAGPFATKNLIKSGFMVIIIIIIVITGVLCSDFFFFFYGTWNLIIIMSLPCLGRGRKPRYEDCQVRLEEPLQRGIDRQI